MARKNSSSPSAKEVQKFLNGYIECALWSSTDESTPSGGYPLDDNYGPSDLSIESAESMLKDCVSFIEDNYEALEEFMEVTGTDMSQCGHDFWLTRNGHGAGFWDRGAGKIGDVLSKASKPYGESYIVVGDDGQLHVN